MDDQNIVDKFIKNSGKKMAIGCGIIFFVFILGIAFLYVVIRHMNTIQGLYDNIGNAHNEVEQVLNAFSLKADGAEAEELYNFLNELASKYNDLPEEPETGSVEYGVARDSDFDLPLIMATLHYQKMFAASVYQEGILNYDKLTNREVSNFLNSTIKTDYQYKMFYKWAYLMLGTPYSIPDINLRGLTGSLTAGKVVSKCVAGGEATKSHEEVLEMITDAEYEFAGKETERTGNSGFFSWLLSHFLGNREQDGEKDEKLHNADWDEIYEKVEKAYKASRTDGAESIEAFLNFEQYNPELKCGAGTNLVHRYIRTMNYEQYKVYLEKVFIPVNFLDCEKCLYKDSSDELKNRVIHDMIRDIFASSKAFYMYANLEPVDYDNLDKEGDSLSGAVLSSMTSPLASKSCSVTSPYTNLRGAYAHQAIDSIVGNASESIGTDPISQILTGDSVVAIADGTVKEVTFLTDRQLDFDSETMACPDEMHLSGGIYVIIEHQIGGKTYQSRYYHLKKDSITVRQGDKVVKGQKIAEIGSTGCSTGPHLHFEVYNEATKKNVNPNSLFSVCNNWEATAAFKLPTTDAYYAGAMIEVTDDPKEPGKESGIMPLEVYITGVVKAEMGGGYSESKKQAYKAQAIAARTYAMYITNWGQGTIENSSRNQNMVAVDIEGDDQALYKTVLETQGMVMTKTSDIFMSEYSNWPCQIVNEDYLVFDDWDDAYRLERASFVTAYYQKLSYPDVIIQPGSFPRLDYSGCSTAECRRDRYRQWHSAVQGMIDDINEELRMSYEYMNGGSCSWYYSSDGDYTGDGENEELQTPLPDPLKFLADNGFVSGHVAADFKYEPLTSEVHRFSVPYTYIDGSILYGHNRGMSQYGAYYLSDTGHTYVEILNTFYHSVDGEIEILTAPSLVTIFGDENGFLELNAMEFDYGETLPGASEWHMCRASKEQDAFYASELKKYINEAEQNAIRRNDVNPLRAKVVAAAYWLAYNPYFKVQYDMGGKYAKEGINNIWGCRRTPSDPDLTVGMSELTTGLDCNAFAHWAFAQVFNKDVGLGTNYGSRRVENCSKGLTVGQIAQVAKLGDVLIKHAACHGSKYGHVAIVFGYDREAGTFSVIHASGYNSNILITTYDDPNEVTNYNWVLSMGKLYGDEGE